MSSNTVENMEIHYIFRPFYPSQCIYFLRQDPRQHFSHSFDGVRRSNLDYLSLDFNSASPSPVLKVCSDQIKDTNEPNCYYEIEQNIRNIYKYVRTNEPLNIITDFLIILPWKRLASVTFSTL